MEISSDVTTTSCHCSKIGSTRGQHKCFTQQFLTTSPSQAKDGQCWAALS